MYVLFTFIFDWTTITMTQTQNQGVNKITKGPTQRQRIRQHHTDFNIEKRVSHQCPRFVDIKCERMDIHMHLNLGPIQRPSATWLSHVSSTLEKYKNWHWIEWVRYIQAEPKKFKKLFKRAVNEHNFRHAHVWGSTKVQKQTHDI